MSTMVRLINDDTGWAEVIELRYEDAVSIPVPFVDYQHGGFGLTLYKLSGERDAQGLPIFRTREQ